MKPLALLLAIALMTWAALPFVAELVGAFGGDEVDSPLMRAVAIDLDGGAE
jgi:hypothetical protein